MTNEELGKFISLENYKETSSSLLKGSEELTGLGVDIVTTTFFGIPVYSLLKPFTDRINDWISRVQIKQMAYFLKEFDQLDQSERSEFSVLIQTHEEDFTERLFYYISQLNDKKKASLCGNLGVAFARKKIDGQLFMRLIQLVSKANYDDLFNFNLKVNKSIKENGDRFDFNDQNMFINFTLFHFTIMKSDYQLLNDLINLNLVQQEINTDVLSKAVSGPNSKVINLEPIAKALKEFKVKYRFTDLAYFLYIEGLSKIKV